METPRHRSPAFPQDSYNSIPDIDFTESSDKMKTCGLDSIKTDLTILAPLLIFGIISVGTIFYKIDQDWDFSTCVYFAAQALVGVMYGVPEETSRISKVVTLFIYFLGSTFVYAAISEYANIIAERAVQSAKDIVRMESVQDVYGDGYISPRNWFRFCVNRALSAVNWNKRKYTYITMSACLCWIVVGVAYDAIMLQGMVTPPCSLTDDGSDVCSLGLFRDVFMAVYLLIGSPLFILTMGQFYEVLVHSALVAKHRKTYMQKFTPEEFQYAANVFRSEADQKIKDARSVDLAEFMLLELMRTETVQESELLYMRRLFEKIDADSSGAIDYNEIEVMRDEKY